ncbi:hypothetical protein KI688_012675 [Linnemannia hyalina]|uniref:Uncharacterized protein n=1 Tax=Linnemannia hyalina TaxID=64524 RepID=A0A9P7XSX9_9FUNG|nr:hypothetical protein KI688_012675 [Linnemannia hyalina]
MCRLYAAGVSSVFGVTGAMGLGPGVSGGDWYKEPSEIQAGSEHPTQPPTPLIATAETATTTTVAPPTPQTAELPVFLDTIRILRLEAYISRWPTDLTTNHTSILGDFLKRMPYLEHLSFQRGLLPDLSVFDGLARNQPPLRYLRIAVAASTGPLTPEMVSTQIFDCYEPGLEDVDISLQGPQDVMEQPWVKKLVQWFDGQNNRRREQCLTDFALSQCSWG